MWYVCGGVRCIRCFGGKTVRYIPLGKLGCRWKRSFKMGFKKYDMGDDLIYLDQEVNLPDASWTLSTAFSYHTSNM